MVTVSGTVDLDGTTLQNARVYLIDQNSHAIVQETATDASGDYSFSGVGSNDNVMVVPWYWDESGQQMLVDRPVANVTGADYTPLPDIGMFQDPLYQFWAGGYDGSDGDSPVPLPEVLAGLSDATAVGGPTYQADQSGLEAILYDGADDGHDWSPDSQLPLGSDPWSFVMLIYPNSGSGAHTMLSYGAANSAERIDYRLNGGTIQADLFGSGVVIQSSSTYPTNQFITAMVTHDGSGNYAAMLNGSSDNTNSGTTPNLSDANHSIGYRAQGDQNYSDAYIAEAVVSGTNESEQAFSDFHDDRLGT